MIHDAIMRAKLALLARLLKWLHGAYSQSQQYDLWMAFDTCRGQVYLHRRDKKRRVAAAAKGL